VSRARRPKPPIVDLLVTNHAGQRVPCTRPALARLAERILVGEGISGEVEISLLYCDDDEIQGLNRQYRRKNKPTDVLSFTLSERCGDRLVLGDIVISLPTASRQSASVGAALNEEVRLLFCHGLLHLLGHDHGTRAEESAMITKQAHYLGVQPEAAWRHVTSH